jgi:Zn-dependent protease with chaperone function
MTFDRANRTVLVMVVLAAAMSAIVAVIGLCSYGALTYRLTRDGFSTWTSAGTQAAFILSVLLTGGLAAGISVIRRELIATRRLDCRVRRHVVERSPLLDRAAAEVGLAGRVKLIEAAEPSAFTWGLRHPRVAVSTALPAQLDPLEPEAVLAHERYHVTNFDPAKLFATRALPAAFFYLPVMRPLLDRYLTARELAADRRALERHGVRPLAGALLKVVSAPNWADLSTAAAIGGDEALDSRLAQLEDGAEPAPTRLSMHSIGLSALGATAVVWSVAAVLVAFGGPAALMRAVCTGS